MTVDDSIKCRCANSGVTGQVGGFQNPGVCLQAFPSFLPHPLPALLLAPLFSRSLTLVPRSSLLNCTETLATQATPQKKLPFGDFCLYYSTGDGHCSIFTRVNCVQYGGFTCKKHTRKILHEQLHAT